MSSNEPALVRSSLQRSSASPRSGRKSLSPRLQAGESGSHPGSVEPAKRATEFQHCATRLCRPLRGLEPSGNMRQKPPPEGGGYGSLAGLAGVRSAVWLIAHHHEVSRHSPASNEPALQWPNMQCSATSAAVHFRNIGDRHLLARDDSVPSPFIGPGKTQDSAAPG